MTSQGWPFLIARGRRLGYRTLLAPEPLIADREYGILDDSIPPGNEQDRPDVLDLTTRTGRSLTVIHATHRVSAADLHEIEEPADEHGRPLRLLYGLVFPRARVPELHQDDLKKALATALETYRRFLDDEENSTVEAGQPFPLLSPLETPSMPPSIDPAVRERRSLAGPVALVMSAAVLVALVVLTLQWIGGGGQEEPLVNCTSAASFVDSTCQPSPSR